MSTNIQKKQEETYNKGQYCPNCFFNNGAVCIGEFRTIEEAMNFPVKEIWCVNRTEDNKFNDYKAKGIRVLIMCDWSKNIQDSRKFIVVLLTKRGKMVYWDMNDLPIETKQFENSLNPKVLKALYSVSDEYYRSNQTKTENNKHNNQINCNKNMNRNRKNVVRLTESKLRNMIKESVRQVLRESYDVDSSDLMDYFRLSREEWNNMTPQEREELYQEYLDYEWDNGRY